MGLAAPADPVEPAVAQDLVVAQERAEVQVPADPALADLAVPADPALVERVVLAAPGERQARQVLLEQTAHLEQMELVVRAE